jgi:hypothetical protein
MDREVVAVILREGSRFLSEFLRNRDAFKSKSPSQPSEIAEPELTENQGNTQEVPKAQADDVQKGCLPCAIGHFGTCSGLMEEALRFGRKDGINSDEVISRINICLDQLNAMERVDLRPEMIVNLPDWEKELVHKTLNVSRDTRHALENISSLDELENVSGNIQAARQEIGKAWFKKRLAQMPQKERTEVAKKVIEKLAEQEEQ